MPRLVEPAGPLWRSAVWSDAGQIVRVHGTQEHAEVRARKIDRVMNPDRGVARPSMPGNAAMLRTRVAMLAQICLTRSQAVEPKRPQPAQPEPAKDFGDPRLGEPGVDLHLNGEPERPQHHSPGALYSEAARRYWAGLFQICFELLQRIDKRPPNRPLPGRNALVPCRYGCGAMVEQPAMLVALLVADGLELAVGCGCFTEPDPGPPSEDSEPPPPMPPPSEPMDPRTVLWLASAPAFERDAGTTYRRLCSAVPIVARMLPPNSEPEEIPAPSEPNEIDDERTEPELDREPDREPDRGQPAPPPDDWIF